MTAREPRAVLPDQIDLAEIRLHVKSLSAAATELAPVLRRAERALLGHLSAQPVDLEQLWLTIEPELGLTKQQHETVRAVQQELSEQAKPVGFAAAGGLILFTSLTGGDALDSDGGDAGSPFDATSVAEQSLDGGGPSFDSATSPTVDLASELAEVVASHPLLADSLGELLDADTPGAEPGGTLLGGPGGTLLDGPRDVVLDGLGGYVTPLGSVLDGLDLGGASDAPGGTGLSDGGGAVDDGAPAAGGDIAPLSSGGTTTVSAGDAAPDADGAGHGRPAGAGNGPSSHASAVAGTTPGLDIAEDAQADEVAGTTPGADVSDLANGGNGNAAPADPAADTTPAPDPAPAADPAPAPDPAPPPPPPPAPGGNGGGGGGGNGNGKP